MQRTNIHPALTALETVMATMSAAQQQVEQRAQWVERSFDEIDPARWTKRIEEAKPEDFERLRVLYDEKALTFMTAWLSQKGAYEHLFGSCTTICDAIRDLIAAHDAIDDKSPEKWLKPIMQNRCIEASEVHRKPRPDRHVDDRNQTFTRAYGILTKAFTGLFDAISAAGPCRQYTTDLVVPGRKYESFLNADVDLRGVHKVEFFDCVNSQHPASQKLAELLDQLDEALKVARLAENRLKGGMNPYDANCSTINNGTINERQHANRLMDALHGEPYGCSPSADHIKAQNERRRLYEAVRHELLIAHRALKEVHEELCETLHAAVLETQQLLTEINADRCTTIDRWQTVRICMNNCLAADLRLRQVGREIQSLQGVYHKDMSAGAGGQAVATQFAEVARQYKPFKLSSDTSAE